MARSTIDFDTVRKIGLALPGVESTAYGLPALKVHGKLLACLHYVDYTAVLVRLSRVNPFRLVSMLGFLICA